MKRILVVDDSSMTRKMIASLLEREGYAIDTAEDGQEALAKVGQEAYDLIITDIDMPQMDGVEFVRRLRQEARRRTPAVVLSSNSAQADVQRALSAGANIYLTKPSPPEKLLASVRSLLHT